MTRRLQICLSVAAIAVAAGQVAPAAAASDPFDGFRTIFEQPWHHKHIHRVRKPVPVKAKDDQSVARPPAPTAAPASDIPDAILPLPAPRPTELPSAAMPPVPPERP